MCHAEFRAKPAGVSMLLLMWRAHLRQFSLSKMSCSSCYWLWLRGKVAFSNPRVGQIEGPTAQSGGVAAWKKLFWTRQLQKKKLSPCSNRCKQWAGPPLAFCLTFSKRKVANSFHQRTIHGESARTSCFVSNVIAGED